MWLCLFFADFKTVFLVETNLNKLTFVILTRIAFTINWNFCSILILFSSVSKGVTNKISTMESDSSDVDDYIDLIIETERLKMHMAETNKQIGPTQAMPSIRIKTEKMDASEINRPAAKSNSNKLIKVRSSFTTSMIRSRAMTVNNRLGKHVTLIPLQCFKNFSLF